MRLPIPLVALALVACAGASKPGPAAPAALAAPAAEAEAGRALGDNRPESVLAVVAMAQPPSQLNGLSALLEAVSPGAGAQVSVPALAALLGQLLAVPELRGLDYARPLFVAMLDPEPRERPFVLVAAVGDATALEDSLAQVPGIDMRRSGGYAAIGGAEEVAAVADYALNALRAAPLPELPTATVFMPAVRATYGARIAMAVTAARAMISSDPELASAGLGLDIIAAMLEQLERVELVVDADGERVTLGVAMRAASDSAMAQFAAAQRPAEFDFAASLPPARAGGLFAGRLEFAQFGEQLAALVAPTFGADAGRWRPLMTAWLELATGEMAMTMTVPLSTSTGAGSEIGMTMAVGVSDPARARELTREIATSGATGYVRYQRVGTPAFRVGDIEVDEWNATADLDKAPESQRDALAAAYAGGMPMMYAPTGDALLVTSGKRARADMEAMLATAGRSRDAIAHPGLAAEVARAKAARESAVMVFDLAIVRAGAGFSLAVGFEAVTTRLRLSLSASQLRAMAAGAP